MFRVNVTVFVEMPLQDFKTCSRGPIREGKMSQDREQILSGGGYSALIFTVRSGAVC